MAIKIILYICIWIVGGNCPMKVETRTPFPDTFVRDHKQAGIMKTIELGNGQVALIDDEDYGLVCNTRWFCNTFGYAVGHVGKKRRAFMHRLILGIINDPLKHSDHINGNRLDNRKCNLRICTYSQNNCNVIPVGLSKFKGVTIDRSKRYYICKKTGERKLITPRDYFLVRIRVNGIRIFIGSFKTEIEAALAYDEAAKKYHGEFAYLNFRD